MTARRAGPRKKPADIARAAIPVFLSQPFDRVTMEQLAEVAGIAKPTLYAHFRSKEEIFAAAIGIHAETAFERLQDQDFQRATIEETLTNFGIAFVRMITDPEIHALHKIMTTESDRHPEIAKLFYFKVVRSGKSALADLIREASRAGVLSCSKPDLAATQFIALCQGEFSYRQELGLPVGSRQQIAAYVRSCVTLFVQGYGCAVQ